MYLLKNGSGIEIKAKSTGTDTDVKISVNIEDIFDAIVSSGTNEPDETIKSYIYIQIEE